MFSVAVLLIVCIVARCTRRRKHNATANHMTTLDATASSFGGSLQEAAYIPDAVAQHEYFQVCVREMVFEHASCVWVCV